VVELGQQWDAAARRVYQEAALRFEIPKTVTEDLRRQPTPIERAAAVQDDDSKPLIDLLDENSHALISGQSGSGKTTAAIKLRNTLRRSRTDISDCQRGVLYSGPVAGVGQ
jgi:hypothetical protein